MKVITIIFFSLLCFSLASQELNNVPAVNDTILRINNDDLKELELKIESERKILFENSLQYLTESLKTLESIKLTDSNDNMKQLERRNYVG